MNNLTTRKIVLGMLMTLVLAFSVQGIADAADLPLTKGSGDLQTKSLNEPFEISFTVGARSNTTSIYNERNQLVTEDGKGLSDNTGRIDAQGYPVQPAGNLVLRTTTVTAVQLTTRPTNYTLTQVKVNNVLSGITYTGAVFADTSRNGYGSDGNPLFYYRPAVPDNPNTEENEAVAAAEQRVTITQTQFSLVTLPGPRYHYNEEKISISLESSEPSGRTMNFHLKQPGFPRTFTELDENPVSDPNGLPRSVTLICTPTSTADPPVTAGTYTIKIADATPVTDTPFPIAPNPRAFIEFTLYVVEGTTQATVTGIRATQRAVYFQGEALRIDEYFKLTGTNNADIAANTDTHLQYAVVEGPGTVYTRTSSTDTGSPTKNLLTSSDATVYLNMNNGRNAVVATIVGQDPDTQGAEIVFHYAGSITGTPPTTTTTTTSQTGSLTIVVTGTGATRSVTVNAVSAAGTPTAIPAVLTGTATSTQTIITGTATEITLPTAPGSYTLTATASVAGYNPDTETITVAGPTSLGTISISQIGTPTNGVQTFSITVRRTDGTTPAPLTVTVSGTGFTTTSVPTANGSGAASLTLPTAAALYTLTARATGYTSGPTTVRIAGTGQQQQQPAQQQPAQQQPTVSEPDSISIIGPSTRSGTVNEALDTPLIVQVLDDDGDGLEGARVFYRVTGRGRISDGSRGGRSIGVITDDDGYARANFTPTAGGSSTVRVNTDDVSRIVTFTITTGSASSASSGMLQHLARGIPAQADYPWHDKSGGACRCGESSADVMGRRWCDLRTCGRESPKIRSEC